MNEKNARRKIILAWALVLILALALFPASSFADEHTEVEATDVALETEENEEAPEETAAEEIVTSEVVFALNQTVYTVDGTNYAMDVAPYIQDSRIMVPVAHVSRALGAEVHWDPGTRTVTVTSGDDVITMVIGSATLLKNGLFFDEMDTVAVIRDIGGGLGRTMIPVSRLARALNVAYTWDPVTRSAVFMPGTIIVPVDPTIEPIVFAEGGTFGPPTRPATINNDVVVSAEDVTLRNYVITGDLIIAEEVGEGSVTLNNVTVQGTTYVRGGGMDSIYIDGGIYNEIIIEKEGGNVRIVYANAEGGHVIITGAVSGTALDRTEIILEGSFEKITVLASYINISFKGDTTVGEIIVEEEAESVALNLNEDTVLNLLTSNSVNLNVEGSGTVKKDGGEERRSIKYADTVTKPVVALGGGGGGGGGGGTSAAPRVDNVSFGTSGNFVEVVFSLNNEATVDVISNQSYRNYELKFDLNIKSRVTVRSIGNAYVFEKTYEKGDSLVITIEELTGSEIVANLVRGETLANNSPVTIELINDADPSAKRTYKVTFVQISG